MLGFDRLELRRAAGPAVLAAAMLWATAAASASNDTVARDFLVQKVCVDPSGQVQRVDPYDCPKGDTLRSLRAGEPLPYHRYDQPMPEHPQGRQRHDSYPMTTADGQEIVVNPFDHAPFDQFKPERDGYSITVVRDGWTSSGGTRSRLLGTTFFGEGCRPYGGWVYFPTSALNGHLIEPGEAKIPIRGDHWEKSGEAWPGRCPSDYNLDTVTSWAPLPSFAFGGPDPASAKTIDAIRSIHGYIDSPRFRRNGHLEVFYFTRLYGLTRWESWLSKAKYDDTPAMGQNREAADRRCSGGDEMVYKGLTWERTDCRDWTSIEVLPAAEPEPAWPVPYLAMSKTDAE